MYDLYINGIDSVELFSDPDLALDHFIAVFNSVSDIHAPYKNLRVKKRSNPWFSHDINSLIHQRNAAWKLARSSGSTNNWQLFRHLRNKCTYSIRRAKASYYVNSLAACGNNSSKFWKILNTIKGASPFSSTLPDKLTSVLRSSLTLQTYAKLSTPTLLRLVTYLISVMPWSPCWEVQVPFFRAHASALEISLCGAST